MSVPAPVIREWNPVKELKVPQGLGALTVGAPAWNPVKELKEYTPIVSIARSEDCGIR